ncbi:MAG TPA: hypothetical protein EYH31_10505, partial [Anaerolineae bacterium]|nr:hypothetical protein [Anaerolineae bacterium]
MGTTAATGLPSRSRIEAAALFHSLIKSHPFMDGTKRTAFASAIYF